MPELQELKDAIEEKGKAWHEYKSTVDKAIEELKSNNGKLSAEAEAKIEEINIALEAANEKKQAMEERLGLVETAIQRGSVSSNDEKSAPAEVEEYKDAFFKAMKKGHLSAGSSNDHLEELLSKAAEADPEFKNLARQSEADGGYLVPPDLSGRIIEVLRESSPMRELSAVQSISTDALEGLVDEQAVSFEWVGETETPPNATNAQWKKWRINVHEMAARVRISQQLIEDAQFDPESWSTQKIADAFSRGEAWAFVNGNGVAKPRGLITYPHSAPNSKDNGATASPFDPENGIQPRETMERIATGVSADLTGVTGANAILDLVYSLKAPYRANARFMFSREGIFKVRLLKDSDNRFYWQPGLQAGQPDMLVGYGVAEMNDLPAFADGAVVGGFGDFSRTYQIVDRISMSMLRDPFTVKPFVELYVRRRVGGDVVNFDTMKLLEASVSV